MKHFLQWALAAAVVFSVAGCSSSDDTPTLPPVTNRTIEFKKGDTFKYSYYDRDSVTDQRIDSSKKVKQWDVIASGLTLDGYTNVVQIEETTFSDLAATQVASKDTFYFQATGNGDGKVFQYDALGAVIGRFFAAASYKDSIPAIWVQISDTKTSSAATWNSLYAGDLTTLLNVPSPLGGGTIPVPLTIDMTASHKGTQATTVGAGTFGASVHTDHQIVVSGTYSGQTVVQDTLTLSYDVDATAGVLRQVLHAGTFTPQGQLALMIGPKKIDGFELELQSYTRAQ